MTEHDLDISTAGVVIRENVEFAAVTVLEKLIQVADTASLESAFTLLFGFRAVFRAARLVGAALFVDELRIFKLFA